MDQQREGDAGYQWWKDKTTFRVMDRPDGNFDEAVSYIFEEMDRHFRSTTLSGIRRLNEPGSFLGEAESLRRFRKLVKENGPWDHKATLRDGSLNEGQRHRFNGRPAIWFYSPEDKSKYFFDVFSNIHYGYLGSAVGYDNGLLLDAAGHVQKRTSVGKARVEKFLRENDRPENLHSAYLRLQWGDRGWDDPMDQSAIQLGIYLHGKYGGNMTRENLVSEMRRWEGLNKERKHP